MRRLVVFLVVFVAAAAQPAYADDLSNREQDVKQQLANASAQITQLNLQMATLEKSVADTQQRIQRERAQVRLLARALYAQPDSLFGMLFESASLTEAVTRISDLTSAGDRASATKRQLDKDLARMTQQRTQLQSDRDKTVELQKQLETQFSKLVAQVVAARLQSPAPTQPPLSLDPGSVGAIQQIILDAFAPLGAAAQSWALRVAKCESNYNPYAVNKSSGASGLFQFLPSTWASSPYHASSPFDPTANAKAAAWLYQRSGPGQWVCSSLV
ncbi:MAG TPA: transglycosylase SLT domain-containing protein [Candidatus Dormibacteraeota bacterium]|jgi:soluble lytic murein transglycosylase-like protein